MVWSLSKLACRVNLSKNCILQLYYMQRMSKKHLLMWFNCYTCRLVKTKIIFISLPSILHSQWRLYRRYFIAKNFCNILKHVFNRCSVLSKEPTRLCLPWFTRDYCTGLSSCEVFGRSFSHTITCMFVLFPVLVLLYEA